MFEDFCCKDCSCGKEHLFDSKVVIKNGAINDLPQILRSIGSGSAFVFADSNTFKAAGKRVVEILDNNGIKTGKYVFKKLSTFSL